MPALIAATASSSRVFKLTTLVGPNAHCTSCAVTASHQSAKRLGKPIQKKIMPLDHRILIGATSTGGKPVLSRRYRQGLLPDRRLRLWTNQVEPGRRLVEVEQQSSPRRSLTTSDEVIDIAFPL